MKTISFIFVVLFCIFSFFPVSSIGMNYGRFNLGVFGGANYNEISNLREMVVSEDHYSGYVLDFHPRFGFTGGLFLNYRASHLFGFQPELTFSMQHGMLAYSDINSFEYDLTFKYNYLNLGVGFKFYPWRNFFLSATPQIGFNLSPNSLFYVSNGESTYGPDLETQQLMRTAIKGRNNVSLGLGLGYQFLNRIYVDARYYFGISDMIETLPNNYRFVENTNLANTVQFTVGYTILQLK